MLSRRQLRIKAIKALYAHLKSDSDNMIASEKNMMNSIDKTYDLYFQMMTLPVELAHYAQQRQELAKQKKLPTYEDLHPNTRFIDNAVIRMIADSDTVNDRMAARKLGWSKYPELIRTLYNQLAATDYFQAYMSASESSFKADAALLATFFEKELQDCPMLDDVLEEQSILWSDDLGFVLTLVIRTISNMRQSHADVKMLPEFKSDEDAEFVKTLFEKTLINYNERLEYFFEKELQDCPMLDDVLEEQSILWSDDLGFVLTLVIRTISNMRQSHADVKMLPEFKSDEDAEFVKTLFEKTLINYNERLEYIEKFTRNWDVERIVFMDNLIMATAITELVSFPSIPVKVTLDEYIDIAKFYSTPGSSTFINGVLDKIVEALTEEGKLKKTGRGLI